MTGHLSPSLLPRREKLIWWHAAALIGVCAAVYFLGLSWRSFASSEGHRVAPAWEMLDRGDPWRITLFEQTYFRKPPGMPWAIAAMSAALGRGEFAARAVSALASTLGALAAWWFSSRWFGPRHGIVAGLALALMPQLWSPGRTAEIEALNNLGTLLAAFAMVDVALRGARMNSHVGSLAHAGGPPSATSPGEGPIIAGRIGPAAEPDASNDLPPPVTMHRRAWATLDRGRTLLIGAAGLIIAALAKGPASAPVFGGVLIAITIMRLWTRRTLMGVLAMCVLAAAALIPIARRTYAANADPTAVTQGADEFLWSEGLPGAIFLLPMALVSALPTSLVLMFPWGKDADDEARHDSGGFAARRAARLLGWSWLAALVVCALIGVGKPRYAMPAAALLAPMACYVLRGSWGPRATFTAKRRHLVKRLTLGNPLAIPVILCVAAVLTTMAARRYKIGVDGREAGAIIARASQVARVSGPSVDLWANGLIDARPDVLLYARQNRPELRPLWKPREMAAGELPPVGSLLLLRVDGEGDERPKYEEAILKADLVALGDGDVGRYKYRVFERVANVSTK